MAGSAWGGLIQHRLPCRCQWTCSCTRRIAAVPRRPWPWRRQRRVTAVTGTKTLMCPSLQPLRRPPSKGPGKPGRGPQFQPQGVQSIPSPCPQLNLRGIVGQVQGAGACGGLWHQVQSIHAWEKEKRVGSWHGTWILAQCRDLAPCRDPSLVKTDSLCPFWVDNDLHWEAAPASDKLEKAAEIL